MDPQPDLGSADFEKWTRDGYLHFPGFFSDPEVAFADRLLEETWRLRPGNVTVDDVETGRRCRMSRIEERDRSHRIKVSDLYLISEKLRGLLLSERIVSFLSSLLSCEPVLCNTLHLERSSAQDYHSDSLFMTPATPGKLIAAWMALEDVRHGSGPLRLYPGSHRIAAFRFSNGLHHAVEGEMPNWAAYMQKEIDSRGLQSRSLLTAKGALVLWHADVLHGAEPIADPALTRRSLVAHYFSLEDCRRRGYRLARAGSGRWVRRRPQPVDTLTRLLCAAARRLESLRAGVAR